MPAFVPLITGGPPYLPCKEHADFKSASQRRKHLNLLLLDGCNEFERTYKPSGWPNQPLQEPIEPHHWGMPSAAPTESVVPARSAASAAAVDMTSNAQQKWRCAYEEGGAAASDLARQVGSKRTPAGTFFNLTKPGHVRIGATAGDGINMPAEDHKQHQASGYIGNAASSAEEHGSRTWLMPHQVADGSRKQGIHMAKAVNSSRTPIGAFAVFDLAKAPK